uniref:hypothetical protein n=1 Tax=Paractinoplanes polyasparticus TaxID=2856853 RepID=UPI001C849283|nr:hypothetical protein [Actinoplanes polyasparticus]
MVTVPRAADLPVGSVVADGVQALFRYGPSSDSWRSTWSGASRLDDAYVDQVLAAEARVLRVGDGSGQ